MFFQLICVDVTWDVTCFWNRSPISVGDTQWWSKRVTMWLHLLCWTSGWLGETLAGWIRWLYLCLTQGTWHPLNFGMDASWGTERDRWKRVGGGNKFVPLCFINLTSCVTRTSCRYLFIYLFIYSLIQI